ncbi:hypothetical protein HBI99_12640 [Aeromonas veronii]|nr:hypothetical protein [Aeromonas veronii]
MAGLTAALLPNRTEGYSTAEVTLTASAPTRSPPKPREHERLLVSLRFVGEVVDVAGWLGGYDFQWAWSSGWVAGQFC